MKEKIVFVGRSNVGKSSTIRALTGKRVKVGKRPGVTLNPSFIPFGRHTIVDMPGFGFMQGVSKKRQEEIKDFIVHYLENSEEIILAVQITNAKAFSKIAKRWDERGHVPVEIEMFHFLKELELRPILAANKIDKIPKSQRDETLDEMSKLLGLERGWQETGDIVPVSAKTKEGIEDLKKKIRERISSRPTVKYKNLSNR